MKKYNTIQEIIDQGMKLKEKPVSSLKVNVTTGNKGAIGQMVELYFGLLNNNLPQADFKPLGLDVELKTTPIKISAKKLVAKERLVLGMIDFSEDSKIEKFEDSRIYQKIKNIVIVNYLSNSEKEVFMDTWELKYSDEEWQIIKNDFETIIGKIKSGKAHELSDSDTAFLSASRKGHKEGPVTQPFSEFKAQKRAWCLKTGFMTRKTHEHYYNIVEKIGVFGKNALAASIEKNLSKFIGKTSDEILLSLGQKPQKNKSKNANAVAWALKAEKIPAYLLTSYDLLFKTMKLRKNGKLQESMSFSQLDFENLDSTEFEESEIYQYLSNGVIINIFSWDDKYIKTVYAKFTEEEIDNARIAFEKIKDSLSSNHIYRPKLKEKLTIHMRPKGKDSKDVVKLKTGEVITKQTLWINKEALNFKI